MKKNVEPQGAGIPAQAITEIRSANAMEVVHELRSKSYIRNCAFQIPREMVSDEYDSYANVTSLLIYRYHRPIGTVRLTTQHEARDFFDSLPSMRIFLDTISDRIGLTAPLVEIDCFAMPEIRYLRSEMLTPLIQEIHRRIRESKSDTVLIMAGPKQTSFLRRLGFRAISPIRQHPIFGTPVVLMVSEPRSKIASENCGEIQ